jgi:anthranilate synthase component 1
MQIEPTADAFAARYERGEPQVLWTTLVADLETPVSAFLKIAGSRPMSFLFESVEGGAVRGRYSVIGLDPDLVWRTNGAQAELNRNAERKPLAFAPCPQPPLEALRALIVESRIALPDGLPPMAAGVFGYLGYDMVRLMEELPASHPDPIGIPDAVLIRPTLVVVFDAVKDSITVVTPVRPETGVTAKAALTRAHERLAGVVDALDRPLDKATAASEPGPLDIPAKSNTSAAEFRTMVQKAKDYILAGDIFQVVLSQRFSAPFTLPPLALYRALRRVNPAPFLYFLDFGGYAIAGSSPEVLVRLRDGTVTIRPLAGTRPRGETPHEDKALEEQLLADPKERAEHLMLLDLGRNDVGRVAKIGSVKVTDQFFIERYSHVMHIVSNVEGTLSDKHDALDALAAGFPAGTVSGAPKVRAMQIIDELEKEKRGLYAGCVGYFSAAGEMDSCIVLRTALIKDGTMYVQSGAGIVADSDPASELAECVNKAKALFRAAEEARRFASAAGRGQ